MTTKLEARARELASVYCDREDYTGPDSEDIAEAMVQLAREFAAEALREYITKQLGEAWSKDDDDIAAAIAAAERGGGER